jgi:ferredoxin-NADP reductase
MQSIIETLANGNLGLMLGITLVGAFAAQSILLVFSSLQRAAFTREQQRLARERLQFQIKAAQLECKEAEQAQLLWNGYRKFQIAQKRQECDGVWSFRLEPHDRKPLPAFKPGQYLTFQLNCPGRDKPVVRCYSLSDAPKPDYYRVTIKREGPPPDKPELPPGAASSFFCDLLKDGDIIDAKAPSGHFNLDMSKDTPVVLISAGVGVTPMLCMANAIAAIGSKRECWFFFGARNGAEHIHRAEIDKLRAYDNIQVHVCYSRPRPEDRKGADYQHEGRVTIELFKQLLPSNNYEYYLCGPGAFMKSITDDLHTWGVPDSAVFFEAFGPATVKKAPAATAPAPVAPGAPAVKVTFGKSGKTCDWQPGLSVLELAEAHGIRIDAGCRAGSCGTCLVAIQSGNVEYLTKTEVQPEEGSCLTCICRPKTDLVLDA